MYSHRPVVLSDLRPVMGTHGPFDFGSNLVSTRLRWTWWGGVPYLPLLIRRGAGANLDGDTS